MALTTAKEPRHIEHAALAVRASLVREFTGSIRATCITSTRPWELFFTYFQEMKSLLKRFAEGRRFNEHVISLYTKSALPYNARSTSAPDNSKCALAPTSKATVRIQWDSLRDMAGHIDVCARWATYTEKFVRQISAYTALIVAYKDTERPIARREDTATSAHVKFFKDYDDMLAPPIKCKNFLTQINSMWLRRYAVHPPDIIAVY